MTPRLSRLAATVLLAIPLIASHAGAQEARTEEVRDILKAVRLDQAKLKNVSFLDEGGNPISSAEFLRQTAAGKRFVRTMKQVGDGYSDVSFKLTTEEALAEMRKPAQKLGPGDPFPEFKLARLDGTTIDKQSLKGRYTLVGFYFADCAPCVKEVPELNALARNRSDINFLGVTFDSAGEAKKFVADTGFSWPLLADARALANGAGVKAYPSFALLDPEGRLVDLELGDRIRSGGAGVAAWLDAKLAAVKR